MADADEDFFPQSVPHNPSTSTAHAHTDADPTDEAQDYRFLASLSTTSDTTRAEFSIPRRGEKDFEPLPFLSSQSNALNASRAAMHAALSWPRVHVGKTHLVGTYFEENDVPGSLGARMRKMEGRCVRIALFRGALGRTMGKEDAKNGSWLWPEEALFLVDRGSLDIRWVVDGQDGDDSEEVEISTEVTGAQEEDKDDQSIPMSLQAAYASFIGKSGLTLERYLVFAGLRRLGYVVTRAPTWSDDEVGLNGHTRQPNSIQVASHVKSITPARTTSGIVSVLGRWLQSLFAPKRGESCPSLGPLVAPGLYRNYNDIFRALTLVPYYDSTTPNAPPQIPKTQPKAPFRIAYNVYKPSTKYRKTLPPEPDFRIAVINARSSSVPTVQQIGGLLDSLPNDELPRDQRLEQRLKHGKKNVILAIVDSGVVSYLRLSETGFGNVKLFEEKTKRGGKRSRQKGKGKGKGKGI